VLALIENMKMQLNSREILLEQLRQFREINGKIPSISELEHCLSDVSLDQIATHFGSYYSYLSAAFENGIGQHSMITRLREFVQSFYRQHKIAPSLRAISHHFMEKQLYEFSEKEIQLLLPDLKKNEDDILATSTSNAELNKMNEKILEPCHLIEKFKTEISSWSELRKLPAADLDEIKKKYPSASVFLKKLKDAQ